jgi:drug/metabolite transporter (DMT)-like permease
MVDREIAGSRPHPDGTASGWVEAVAYFMLIGVLSLTYAIGHLYGAHPVAFILYAMLVSALAMLLVTGLGPDFRAIVRSPQSWLVGTGIMAIEVFYYILLAYVPPATGSLVMRLAIPFSLAVGLVLYGRQPTRLAVAGGVVVTAAIALALTTVDQAAFWPALAAAVASALSFVLRGFGAEFHPWNRAARTVSEKIRVTGAVVLVTSIVALGLAVVALAGHGVGLIPTSVALPTAAELTHGPTLVLALVVGALVLTAMAYLNFSSVVKITTENFTAVSAFTPVFTLVIQEIAAAAGVIPRVTVAPMLLLAMAIAVAGVLLIFIDARRRHLAGRVAH